MKTSRFLTMTAAAALLLSELTQLAASLTIQECSAPGQCTPLEAGVVLDKAWGCSSSDPECMGANGISVQGSELTLKHTTSRGVGSRVYLTEGNDNYKMFKMLNKEVAFDIDTSTLPCNGCGAFYFVQMPQHGAATGDNYCDAPGITGPRCVEMDVWEGNTVSNAFTSHSCQGGQCDNNGCAANAMQQPGLYGIGKQVDSSKPFTVVTQFIGAQGLLTDIHRKYKQGDTVIDAQSISSCQANGGFSVMGQSLDDGLVLAISLWGGSSFDLNWLDGCPAGTGSPAQFQQAFVKYSNIRIGAIDSTLGGSTLPVPNPPQPTIQVPTDPPQPTTQPPTNPPEPVTDVPEQPTEPQLPMDPPQPPTVTVDQQYDPQSPIDEQFQPQDPTNDPQASTMPYDPQYEPQLPLEEQSQAQDPTDPPQALPPCKTHDLQSYEPQAPIEEQPQSQEPSDTPQPWSEPEAPTEEQPEPQDPTEPPQPWTEASDQYEPEAPSEEQPEPQDPTDPPQPWSGTPEQNPCKNHSRGKKHYLRKHHIH